MALRIFVADDHEVVRRGICALLTAHHGWEICGEAADGREAVEKVNHLQPDIVILDIGMPALNGLEAARQILHNNSHQKIAILSITDSEQVIQEALRAGAKAYILKSDGAKDLIVAIEKEFAVRFTTAEVTGMKSVGDLYDLIARKAG